MLLTTRFPKGRANLVLELPTGSYKGKIVKRMPFTFDNPQYGKPVQELDETKKLREDHPDAKVVELFQDAPLPQFGIPSYDGVRDVYFGDPKYVSSYIRVGNAYRFGADLRYHLQLGAGGYATLIRYDLSFLPKNAKVVKALLSFRVKKVNTKADLKCQAFALKKRWHETYIGHVGGLNIGNSPKPRNGLALGNVENWDKPMFKGAGDRSEKPVAEFSFSKAGRTTLDLTAAAQKWVDGSMANHGVALQMAAPPRKTWKPDVSMTASDYPVDLAMRPRLVLVLEGDPKCTEYKVKELNADLAKAREEAKASKKLILCQVLHPGSVTSRALESKLLEGSAELKAFIEKRYVEMRIDGSDPKHAALLKRYGVRHFPSAIVLPADDSKPDNYDRFEPYDWDNTTGAMRSSFEFPQMYAANLDKIAKYHQKTGKLGGIRKATVGGGCR